MILDKDIQSPLIYKGEEYPDYGVHKKLGGIYSKKVGGSKTKTGVWKKMAPATNSTKKLIKAGKKGYLKTRISPKKGKIKNVYIHIATHETLNPELPPPPGIHETIWRTTHPSVKKLLRDIYQVNHINHDTTDYSPENLEWVTAQENVDSYQVYYKSQKEAA